MGDGKLSLDDIRNNKDPSSTSFPQSHNRPYPSLGTCRPFKGFDSFFWASHALKGEIVTWIPLPPCLEGEIVIILGLERGLEALIFPSLEGWDKILCWSWGLLMWGENIP
jgi:hypothetical protein